MSEIEINTDGACRHQRIAADKLQIAQEGRACRAVLPYRPTLAFCAVLPIEPARLVQ